MNNPSIPAARPLRPFQCENLQQWRVFKERWCNSCSSFAGCKIPQLATTFDPGDPQYPKDWVVAENGNPMCLAFRPFDNVSGS